MNGALECAPSLSQNSSVLHDELTHVCNTMQTKNTDNENIFAKYSQINFQTGVLFIGMNTRV
jgi:hypothetical protein